MGLLITLHWYFEKICAHDLFIELIYCTSWDEFKKIFDAIFANGVMRQREIYGYITTELPATHPAKVEFDRMCEFLLLRERVNHYNGRITERMRRKDEYYWQFCFFKNLDFDFSRGFIYKENDEWFTIE